LDVAAGCSTAFMSWVQFPSWQVGTDRTVFLLLIWKLFGCGNRANSTPFAANLAPVQL
jgi:hypothetical protein